MARVAVKLTPTRSVGDGRRRGQVFVYLLVDRTHFQPPHKQINIERSERAAISPRPLIEIPRARGSGDFLAMLNFTGDDTEEDHFRNGPRHLSSPFSLRTPCRKVVADDANNISGYSRFS